MCMNTQTCNNKYKNKCNYVFKRQSGILALHVISNFDTYLKRLLILFFNYSILTYLNQSGCFLIHLNRSNTLSCNECRSISENPAVFYKARH